MLGSCFARKIGECAWGRNLGIESVERVYVVSSCWVFCFVVVFLEVLVEVSL